MSFAPWGFGGGSNNHEPKSLWWREGSPGGKVSGATFLKIRDNPEFTVALGVIEYTIGVHEFDFTVDKNRDSYMYFGVSRPSIERDQTFCKRGSPSWYFFSTGHTCALRHGYEDVFSKEKGMKLPRLQHGERVRMTLDMTEGTLSFSLVSQHLSTVREVPGKLTGISGPVTIAVCIQNRNDSVTVGEVATRSPQPPRGVSACLPAGAKSWQKGVSPVPAPLLNSAAKDAVRRRLFGLSSEEYEARAHNIESRKLGERPSTNGATKGRKGPMGHIEHPWFRQKTKQRPMSGSLCNLGKNHFEDFDVAIGSGVQTILPSPRVIAQHDFASGLTSGGGVGVNRPELCMMSTCRAWHRVQQQPESAPQAWTPSPRTHISHLATMVPSSSASRRQRAEEDGLMSLCTSASSSEIGDTHLASTLTIMRLHKGLEAEGGGGVCWNPCNRGLDRILGGRTELGRGVGGTLQEKLAGFGGRLGCVRGGIRLVAEGTGHAVGGLRGTIGGVDSVYQKAIMTKILMMSCSSAERGKGGAAGKGRKPGSVMGGACSSSTASASLRQASRYFGGASRGPGYVDSMAIISRS